MSLYLYLLLMYFSNKQTFDGMRLEQEIQTEKLLTTFKDI